MKLKEQDWNAPGGVAEVDVEYADTRPVEEFINWLRRTNRWREDIHDVERRLMRLNAALLEQRTVAPTPAPTVTPKPDRFAKAREAKARKRAALAAGV